MLIVLTYAFAAAVLGGIDSPFGAVVGAYILGVGISLLSAYVHQISVPSSSCRVALGVLLLVLMVRPNGLFGHPIARRV